MAFVSDLHIYRPEHFAKNMFGQGVPLRATKESCQDVSCFRLSKQSFICHFRVYVLCKGRSIVLHATHMCWYSINHKKSAPADFFFFRHNKNYRNSSSYTQNQIFNDREEIPIPKDTHHIFFLNFMGYIPPSLSKDTKIKHLLGREIERVHTLHEQFSGYKNGAYAQRIKLG